MPRTFVRFGRAASQELVAAVRDLNAVVQVLFEAANTVCRARLVAPKTRPRRLPSVAESQGGGAPFPILRCSKACPAVFQSRSKPKQSE